MSAQLQSVVEPVSEAANVSVHRGLLAWYKILIDLRSVKEECKQSNDRPFEAKPFSGLIQRILDSRTPQGFLKFHFQQEVGFGHIFETAIGIGILNLVSDAEDLSSETQRQIKGALNACLFGIATDKFVFKGLSNDLKERSILIELLALGEIFTYEQKRLTPVPSFAVAVKQNITLFSFMLGDLPPEWNQYLVDLLRGQDSDWSTLQQSPLQSGLIEFLDRLENN